MHFLPLFIQFGVIINLGLSYFEVRWHLIVHFWPIFEATRLCIPILSPELNTLCSLSVWVDLALPAHLDVLEILGVLLSVDVVHDLQSEQSGRIGRLVIVEVELAGKRLILELLCAISDIAKHEEVYTCCPGHERGPADDFRLVAATFLLDIGAELSWAQF